MVYINGISEVANPALIVIPIILMTISGYSIGKLLSYFRQVDSIIFRDLTYGNIILNFLFISGFILFGVVTYSVKIYFDIFTYILMILTAIGIYFLLKPLMHKSKINFRTAFDGAKILILFGAALFASIIVYQGIIIYYHPIFSEYDAIYDYLLTSKSILLGNGLNHDFYRGSDVTIGTPPISNAINAWLMNSFGYSSLRLFPLYFVFLTSLVVFYFARNVTKDSFIGLMASTSFLITPAILVMSSRFSLYNDIMFTLFLISSFLFLCKIVSSTKPAKTHLLMLVISLSLVSLSKEIGIVTAIMIFSLLPAIKFSLGNAKLKIFFTTLSFLPLYGLTFYDLFQNDLTFVIGIRLITVFLANLITYYLILQVKNQEKFSTLLHNFKYLLPLGFPLIFIALNLVNIGGPYPELILSSSAQQSLHMYRDLYGIQNNLFLDLSDSLQKIPRVDVLFFALAAGPIFVFFKFRGFAILITKLKSNSMYVGILLSVILLLLVWSYFDLGFETSQIRHLAYFAPLLAVIITLGMHRMTTPYKMYYYGMIVYSTFYFLSNSVQAWFYSNTFAGFWIEPYNDPILTFGDILIVVAFVSPLIVLEAREHKIQQRFLKFKLKKIKFFILIPLAFMLGFQLYVLLNSNITLDSLEEVDKTPPNGWENDVFDVVTYLNHAENGNVLSVRAPAISFFTNRTNFDLYSTHTLAEIAPLLQIENSTLFEQRISEMNIGYFVIPNENSVNYKTVQNLADESSLIQILNNDDNFIRIGLQSFDIYKFDRSAGINLIDENHMWAPVNKAEIYANNSSLNITVRTNDTDMIYNRGVIQTQINFPKPPVLLLLDYASKSDSGQATFSIEISGYDDKFLWGSRLSNTGGNFEKQSFILPDNVLNKNVKIKLYVITTEPGSHTLTVKKMRIIHT